LLRSEIAQGLMRTDVVIHPFPLLQSLAQKCHLQLTVINLIELLRVGPVSSLYRPFSLGIVVAPQNEEFDLMPLTLLLEHRFKFWPTIKALLWNPSSHCPAISRLRRTMVASS
jgi:hypothetical protein